MGQNNPVAGGWSGMTPDQSNMVSQVGWAPNPDMVLPTGSTQQSMFPTQGYSNLTPAQAATANQLGYYSQPGTPGATAPTNIFDKLGKISGLLGGNKNPADAINQGIQSEAQANARAAMNNTPPSAAQQQLFQMMKQYGGASGLYDPSFLMQLLFQGTPPPGTGSMGSLTNQGTNYSNSLARMV